MACLKKEDKAGAVITQYKEDGSPLRYFTGVPCCKGHIADRLVSTDCCVECRRIKSLKGRLRPVEHLEGVVITKYSPDGVPLRYTTGVPCPNGHMAERRYSNKVCTACAVINKKKWLKTEKGKKALTRYRPNANASSRKYSKTDKGKVWPSSERGRKSAAMAHHRRRVAIQGQGLAPFTIDELSNRYSLFDNKCAYCLSDSRPTMDHFIPIKKLGHHCISNIVPACKSCNSKKNSKMPYVWFKSQEFFDQDRWEFIIKNTVACDGVAYSGGFLVEYLRLNPWEYDKNSQEPDNDYVEEYLASLSDEDE